MPRSGGPITPPMSPWRDRHRVGEALSPPGPRPDAVNDRDRVATCRSVSDIEPRIEGTVKVALNRRLGFAEFGAPEGRAVVWLHGTPGARRQVPHEARVMAEREGLRVVGIDRPGIGSSS